MLQFSMKLVATLKVTDRNPFRQKKARLCICGHSQKTGHPDMYYTANTEASSLRLVLHEVAQRRVGFPLGGYSDDVSDRYNTD